MADDKQADADYVYILATLDTKGQEAAYVRDLLVGLGVRARLVDVGCLGAPSATADIDREQFFAAGGFDVARLAADADRGLAVSAAAQSAAVWMAGVWKAGAHSASSVAGVLALGGSAGTTIGAAAMRVLPLEVPKLMVSTLASGQVRHYVDDKNILMLNSVVDIAGLNRITRHVLGDAARAMAGMVLLPREKLDSADRPLVAATMFGVTTPCVEQAKVVLEQAGYEVIVFHATGSGGQAMESLVRDGMIAGVLDITTTELADELVGGVLSAGHKRLTAAAECGVPQLVSTGATDMVNFHSPASVPKRFRGRTFYHHNPNVTLMRTTEKESARIGAEMGQKLSRAVGPVAVLAPMRGVSAIDRAGQPFDDPAARRALVESLRSAAPNVEVREMDCHINDPEFAIAAANRLLELMKTAQPPEKREGSHRA